MRFSEAFVSAPLIRALSLLTLAGLSSACGVNTYCLTDQPYQRAQIAPEMKPVEGLSLPTTGSALRLPEAPENPKPFGVKNEEGAGVCLDKPPRLVMPEPKNPKKA